MDGTEESITGVIEELNTYGLHSGLKINIEKTSCMAIESLNENEINAQLNDKFVKELKILGVQMNRDVAHVADHNIQLKIPTIKNGMAQ